MDRNEYVRELLGQEDEILREVRRRIEEAGMPTISVAPEWGKMLTMLVRMTRANRVLEIGALGGYSGICLARGLGPNGQLVSLEIEQKYADFAMDNLTMAGLSHLVEYWVGDAHDTLPLLAAEGKRFDLIFIDADKASYPDYLEWAIRLSRSGSVIVADNTMMHDRVLDPTDKRKATLAMRQFNQMIARDARLEGLVIPFRDGLAVAYVK